MRYTYKNTRKAQSAQLKSVLEPIQSVLEHKRAESAKTLRRHRQLRQAAKAQRCTFAALAALQEVK